jgi:hypothetical protein
MASAADFALSPATRLAVVKDQVSCEIDREAVILHLKSGVYYGLNEVGARVWALLQQPTSLAEIEATISSEFEVSSEQCAADVRALLGQFHSAGLIEVVGERVS